jgi:hypothetical protein
MPLAERLLVIAFLAQIVWTFVVMAMTARVRFRAAARREIRGDVSLDLTGYPDYARKVANNMNNQWETPTLFYALILLILTLHISSLILAILAFVYVAARVAHTYIHTTTNVVMVRARPFFVGLAALILMTLVISLDLLTGSII